MGKFIKFTKCKFCKPAPKDPTAEKEKDEECLDQVIDYKDVRMLQRMSTPQGKLYSRKRSGTCAMHQRAVKSAIKRARFMGLMPYVGR